MSGATLLLCHRLPFPPNKGDKIRSYALLKHLAARGPVHLACFIDDPEDLAHRDEVRRLAGGKCLFVPVGRAAKLWRALQALLSGQPITLAVFGSRLVSRWLQELFATEKIENFVVFGSAMAPYLLGDATRCSRTLFDMVDVDSDKWRQYAAASSGALRWLYAREARTLLALETKAAQAFGRTLLVSPFEARTFAALAPHSAEKIAALSNGVDLTYYSPGKLPSPFPPDAQAIVMTGRMDYRPNVDGAIWFAKQVAPLVFAKLPSAHVYFVGAHPPAALRRLQDARITVTGAVDDIRPYIQSACAVVAPLLIARGVQNKVLEAMAMTKPVVATAQATRALDVKAGVDLWIENEPARFADAVVTAIESPLRHEVMQNARTYVEQHHDWQQIFVGLDQLLERLAQSTSARDRLTERLRGVTARRFESDVSGAQA